MIFNAADFDDHESIHAFHDASAGLKSYIAIHSTAKGAASGPARMWAYPDEASAISDALRLAETMSTKTALAGVDLGGGAAVIIGSSQDGKSPALFEAFGRAVQSLGGRYWAAHEVGVTPADFADARKSTRFLIGMAGQASTVPDPTAVAVEGVKRGIELCVRLSLGKELADVSVAIQGVGQMGGRLADALAAAGARLVVTDLNAETAKAVALRTGARLVAPGAIFEVPTDVFAPCALGSAINSRTLPLLKAPIVAGGANNQIANDVIRDAMHERGLIYAPDMVINGGRIIASAAEIRAVANGGAYDHAWIEAKLGALMVTLESILRRAHTERRPAADIAIEMAKSRIAEAKQQAA